jgi:predicted KAP-like P-loop ATPase
MNKDDLTKANFTADRPISTESEDAFQRYSFAKRIAETINLRKNKESIVFGLFGSWGEGKSSVINFIQKEISIFGNQYIQISFNPWRYTDEAALLTSFFNKLAIEIKKSIPQTSPPEKANESRLIKSLKKITTSEKQPLKTSSENIGDLIQKYGKIATLVGAGEALETIGKAISNVDTDELKARIERLLETHKKRIIIYLDDIDRLDKSEIHSIFKLVKLTGDFSYTTYILSFDQEMVASAIGERFGTGDKKAGENFLEKIIQIPLNIPKAQPEALKKFCFKLVDNALDINQITLEENEAKRFVLQFTTNILPILTNPRLAVRYGNTLSFSMPMLKGEVNLVDLMLIEAMRVFYPEFYYFVKDNSSFFIGSYSNPYDRSSDNDKKEDIKKHLDRLGENLSKRSNEHIKKLLSDLFPNLNSVFNNVSYSDNTYNQWYLNKRIASTKYFDRYFSYTVIEGDISDVEFEELVSKVEAGEKEEAIADSIQNILLKSSAENFVQKIRSREDDLNWSSSKILIKAICKISESLPCEGGLLNMGFETPFGQAAIFIYQLFNHNKEFAKADLFEFAKELMIYPSQFSFAFEINYWLSSDNKNEDKLFDDTQIQQLSDILIERAITEAGENSLFEMPPKHVNYLSTNWARKDKKSFDKYVESYLEKDPENILNLIKLYVPTITSTAQPKPYKGDLNKERYKHMISIYDAQTLYDKIIEAYPLDELEKEEPEWEDFRQNIFTNINLLRQYLHWYKEENGR